MKTTGYFVLLAVLVLLLAVCAGCTTPTQAPAATQPPAPAATATQAARTAAPTAQGPDLSTNIRVRFNDLACINVGDYLGVTYLYPDQKIKLTAAPASGPGTINVNIVFVDENDQLKLRQAKPQWDTVAKTWVYEGIAPLAQFNDITTNKEKTFTIKTQSKYYICADDRKEAGAQDVTYQVPVTLTRL